MAVKTRRKKPYLVTYYLPANCRREILMSKEELEWWLRYSWLRKRIVTYRKRR